MIKIQVIGSSQSIDKVKRVIELSFPNLDAGYYKYNHFIETSAILQKLPEYTDIILFTGLIPYHLGKDFIPHKNCICTYLSHCKSSLLRALLEAYKKGFRTDIISLDAYKPSDLLLVQKEYDPDGKPITVLPVEDDVFGLNYDTLLMEHIFNYTNKNATCLTTLYTAHKRMLELGVHSIYIGYSMAKIEDVLNYAILEHSLRAETINNFVMLNIKIDPYEEHSCYYQDHYRQAINRAKIITHIYDFARQLNAAVIESSNDEFWIITEHNILKSSTQNLKNIKLSVNVCNSSPHTISVGIGYGKSMPDIENSARRALQKALKDGGNKVVICKDGVMFSPLDDNIVNFSNTEDHCIDKSLVSMVKTTGISIPQVFKLIDIVQNNKNRTFTARELVALTGYNVRTVNRVLEKLEQAGYCKVIGKESLNNAGRPSRVIQFNFEHFNLYTK